MARKNAASHAPSSLTPDESGDMNIGEYGDDENDKRIRGRMKRRSARLAGSMRKALEIATSARLTLMAVALILACLFVNDGAKRSHLMKIGMGYLFVARPLLSTLAICCDGNPGGEGTTTRIVASAFLLSVMCNQLPRWLSALVACGAIFAFGLASRQLTLQQFALASNSQSVQSQNDGLDPLRRSWSRLGLRERAALGGMAVVASLLAENFVVWVVSATYKPGIEGDPEPLQDNGRIVLEGLAMRLFNVTKPWMARRPLQSLRDALNVQYALVSSFGAALVCLELQLGRSSRRTLAGLAFRGTMTLATARLIRTISFALTVLPSQVKNCYRSHFPAPPDDWGPWLMVGFLPNTRGGCNDLILSGHATITSTLGCAFTSAASDTSFSMAVWTLIALDYAIESYQGLHYSVDMWLGCIVTCLLWQLTKPLEVGNERDRTMVQNESTKRDDATRRAPLDATIIAKYAVPAILAFMVLTVVPEAIINYFLVGFSSWAGIYFARYGFTNYLQHVLLCELCFGLGAYL